MTKNAAKKPRKKAQKARKARLCVAIIVDPYGSVSMDKTGEDEIVEHKERLTKLFKGRELVFATPAWVDDRMAADLVIFDFGGMSLGNDLLADNSRRLIRWCEDHPSALVVVASSYTYVHGLQPELRDLGIIPEDAPGASSFDASITPPLANVKVWNGYEDKVQKEITAWFD